MRILTFLFVFGCGFYTIAQSTASGNVSTFVIEAPQLHTQKKIWVYVPENYAQTTRRFPVIYMHDAQNLFDKTTSYAGEWKVDETLNRCNAAVIVVGIEHGGERRIDELTPYTNEKYKGGGGELYLDFIVKTLKPHIDSVYRTRPGRRHTAVMGSSLGGLLSFYAMMKYPGVFGLAGVFSPSFWFSDAIYALVENADRLPDVKLYMATGEKEGASMVDGHKKMAALLLKKGLKKKRIKSVIATGKEHNETFWSEAFPEAYQWLME
ncbi:MAG: alpha/beta hydrolase [Sinomicrobium sp.]|nr:alpha/beta hydrolase [Sinomicrobium sp.]